MEQIITYIKPYLPTIGAVLVGVLCLIVVAVVLIAVLLLIRKKKKKQKTKSNDTVAPISTPLPQKTAHTLLTDDTLELEPVGDNTAFAVEYEITYVHSDEVI